MSAPTSTGLAAELHARIRQEGPITFAEYMAAALYDPRSGYYGAGRASIGREGDFITSVSVGRLFGALLARKFLEKWERLGKPTPFAIIEQGAHDGTLARDVLDGLEEVSPACWDATDYVIVEPRAAWRARQEATLAASGKARWVAAPGELRNLTGVFFANELVDAFPVHRVRWSGGAWRELYVTTEGDAFAWQEGELSSDELGQYLAKIEIPLPEGYETEVNCQMIAWLRGLTAAFAVGYIYLIDYGYERAEYYRPERAHGTLSGYAHQTRVSNLLERPGEIDLTAHVDFTTLIEEAESCGWKLETFTDQHRFLSALSAAHFADTARTTSDAVRAQEVRAFKTLTHPELLGAAFKVVALSKGVG